MPEKYRLNGQEKAWGSEAPTEPGTGASKKQGEVQDSFVQQGLDKESPNNQSKGKKRAAETKAGESARGRESG